MKLTIRRVLVAAVVASALLGPAAAGADRIVTKDGKTYEGKIVKETPESVEIEFTRGSMTGMKVIDRHEIKEIVRDAPEGKKGDGGAASGTGTGTGTGKKKEDPGGGSGKKGGEKGEKGESDYGKEIEGTGDWFLIETPSKRYKIKCNSTREVAQRYADFVDKIVLEYDKVFKGRKHYWKGQSLIYVFRSNEDFRAFMQVEAGVGGFYMAKAQGEYPDRIVAAYHGSFGTGDTRMVLAHECTHQYEHILCDGEWMDFYARPAWWMEGYSTYFGDGFTLTKAGKLEIQIPRMRLGPIQEIIKAGHVPGELKISAFMKWGLHEYQQQAGIAYPFGWSLIYYFQKRCEVPGKQKGTIDYKPIKVKVDGREREANLYKVLNDFFDKIAAKPPEKVDADEGAPERLAEHYVKELENLLGFPVDALTEDWKEFILKLDAPTMGKVDRSKGKFSGTEAGFEIEIPKDLKDWTWNEADCVGDDAIRLESKTSGAMVRIEVDGNMGNTPLCNLPGEERPVDSPTIVTQIDKMIDHMWGNPEIEKSEKTTVAGIADAWEFLYNGTESAMSIGAKVREGQQRVRHLVIGGKAYKRTYQIYCMAPKDRFDECAPAFEKILNSFKVLKD